MMELEGIELDHAVANALGLLIPDKFIYIAPEPGYSSLLSVWVGRKGNNPYPWCYYHPSTDWVIGGDLIEKNHIETMLDRPSGLPKPKAGEGIWTAIINHELDGFWWAHGTTPLIAAMRVLVRSKT